jgi:hypothetical protein
LVKEKGFFSVWYYQFLGQNDVLNALINGMIIGGINIEPLKEHTKHHFKHQTIQLSKDRKIILEAEL